MKRKMITMAGMLLLCASLLCGCKGNGRSDEALMEYRDKGITYMATAEYAKAAEVFQKALDQSSGNIRDIELDICFYKAEAQFLSGDTEGAYETYTAIINWNQSTDAYFLRGNLFLSEGNVTDAIADYEIATAGDSGNYDLYIGIYQNLMDNEMDSEAISYLYSALGIKGESAYDYLMRGRIYDMLSDEEKAIESLNKAIEKGNADANFYLAEIYSEQGDTESEEQYYEAYLAGGTASADSLIQMGESSMKSGNYANGLKYFLTAKDLGDASNPQQLDRDTIIAYEYTSDFETAYNLIQSYMENYPEDYDAEDELTFLESRLPDEISQDD